MVTDEQYRALQKRIDELESRLASLSRQFSAMLMRRDSAEEVRKPSIPSVTHKDITRYRFDGKLLCKRRLVLECVKRYVNDYEVTSADKLREIFPDYIQGSLGIVKDVKEAERYSEAHKRFYFSDNDVIQLKDASMVVCSQWDIKNISRFVALMSDYGYIVEIIERKY